jgi:shikimate kinase
VLLGFSTTGKSALSRAFEALQNSGLVFIYDTDKLIGESYGGHIYNAYLQLGRARALRAIEKEERRFLSDFTAVKPTLIVAGPNLVLRDPEWKDLIKRASPRCFYLTIKPREVYQGLSHRYVEEHAIVGNDRNFGSWNECATTNFEAHFQRWMLVDEKTALANIKSNMRYQVREYEAASKAEDRIRGGPKLRQNSASQARLIEKIRAHLLT